MKPTFPIYSPEKSIFFNHRLMLNVHSEEFRPHTHAVCELILFKKGKVTYSVQGKNYRLRKDDLIITRPSEMHGVLPNIGSDYERYNILFDEKTLPFDIFKKIPPKIDVINVGHNHIIMDAFEKMDYYEKNLPEIQLNLMLINLCQEILINILLELDSTTNQSDYTVTNEIVSNAMAYIDENLLNITNVEEVSKALFVTKSHLHHLFMKNLNISPKKYIISKKMVLAQREILSGKNPTKLYEKYGFNDYSSFYRSYKSHFGLSPSEKTLTEIIVADNNIL